MALRSSIEPVAWPAVQTGTAATLMALQQQFGESQWWPREKLRAAQFDQLRLLVANVLRNVPFYVDHLAKAGIKPGTPLTEAMWANVPVLTREDVRDHGEKLHALSTPPAHGGYTVSTTGGSTGIPVRVRKSELASLMWDAVNIREELWHRDDPGGVLARIATTPSDLPPEQRAAANSPKGLVLPDWGSPTNQIWRTGRLGMMDYGQPIPIQVEFLLRMQPHYIYTTPSSLRLLISHFRERELRLPSLKSVWTRSEVVDTTLREACREVLGCRIVHNYSSAETGYIALQCPEGTHFHTQDETVLVEVLNAAGHVCDPGEVGRVVLTPLHNFSMPLLRYEIGDDAEVGGPCSCGRGLSVLTQIMGRTSDQLVLPSGLRRKVHLNHYRLSGILAIREFQFTQRSLEKVELMLVVARSLNDAEMEQVRGLTRTSFGTDFQVDITFHASLPRTAAGKLRPFISDLPQAG